MKTLAEILKSIGLGKKEKPSNFIVYKEVDGTNRWFGWVTNKWEDREKDILTDAAHIEFLNFLDANPTYAPELWVWHTAGTARKHKADWWDYANGFFMYSGSLTEEEAKAYKRESDEPIGMSHGFYVLQRVGKYITKYRTFEVSELPLAAAANPYTDFQVKEVTHMFTANKRRFLVDRLGEEAVAKMESSTEAREKALEEMGAKWKEINQEYEDEIADEFAAKVEKAAEPTVERVVKEIVEILNVEGLQKALAEHAKGIEETRAYEARIKELEAKIDALIESEDEKIAKALDPVQPFDWSSLASQNKENVVEEEDLPKSVAKETGEFDWLSGFAPRVG